jgi:hypothetical protein
MSEWLVKNNNEGFELVEDPNVVTLYVTVEDALWWKNKGYNENIPELGRITSACREALALKDRQELTDLQRDKNYE